MVAALLAHSPCYSVLASQPFPALSAPPLRAVNPSLPIPDPKTQSKPFHMHKWSLYVWVTPLGRPAPSNSSTPLSCSLSEPSQMPGLAAAGNRWSESKFLLRNVGEGESGKKASAGLYQGTLVPPSHAFPCFSSSHQPATETTGAPTAAAGASVRMGRCATPSRVPATAQQVSEAGAARAAVSTVPTVMTVTRDASARTEPLVTTSQGSVAARPDTREPCK